MCILSASINGAGVNKLGCRAVKRWQYRLVAGFLSQVHINRFYDYINKFYINKKCYTFTEIS